MLEVEHKLKENLTAVYLLQCYETNFYQIVRIVFSRSLKLITIYIFCFVLFCFSLKLGLA